MLPELAIPETQPNGIGNPLYAPSPQPGFSVQLANPVWSPPQLPAPTAAMTRFAAVEQPTMPTASGGDQQAIVSGNPPECLQLCTGNVGRRS